MSRGWFATRGLEPGVWLVAEPPHVCSYLVIGDRRAVLVDSGMGIGDIRAVVEHLTDHDVLVVNTHHHWDHVGGNQRFTDVAIHETGAELLGREVPAERLAAYMAFVRQLLERFGGFRDLDDRFFSFLTEETTPRPLPEGFDPLSWRIVPSVPTRLLREGDRIDLGDRSLRVLHTPGHTPDSICLLDERNGLLFGGDTYSSGPIYAHMPDSDLEAFTRSTARVAGLADAIRTVYMAHFTRYAENAAFVQEVADGFAAITAGEVEWGVAADALGRPVRLARFARFGVFAPPG
jgi:glyoxylase-like metal-dependent hydrolase (beta-lactamase superfamily II)